MLRKIMTPKISSQGALIVNLTNFLNFLSILIDHLSLDYYVPHSLIFMIFTLDESHLCKYYYSNYTMQVLEKWCLNADMLKATNTERWNFRMITKAVECFWLIWSETDGYWIIWNQLCTLDIGEKCEMILKDMRWGGTVLDILNNVEWYGWKIVQYLAENMKW